jgi:GNAT superfamily N-acetyltransferase
MTPPPIEEFVYSHPDLPREFEIQIMAFARLVWGEDLQGDARFRSRMREDPAQTHFVRAADDLLISHAEVLPVPYDVAAGTLRIGGVGGVLTYPQFRGEVHASALMRRAAQHIGRTADIGMLFCDARNVPFYERLGWTPIPRGRVLVKGTVPDDVVMILGGEGMVPDPLRLDWSW